MRSRLISKQATLGAAVAMLFALVVPMAGPAVANHPRSCLDVEPETATNPTQPPMPREHSVTATLRAIPTGATACTGTPVNANNGPVRISFEISGPNDPASDGDTPDTPDTFCIVNPGTSSCVMTYEGSEIGTDTIRGWIDHDALTPAQGGTTEADRTECVDEFDPDPDCAPTTSGDVEPDDTDVVEKEWVPGSPSLDCDDASGNDRETNASGGGPPSSEPYTCTVRDERGEIEEAITTVRGENENGINDPDPEPNEGASYDSPDYSCTTQDPDDPLAGPPGRCTITVHQTDLELGTAEICFWIGSAADGATLCADEPTDEVEQNDNADQVEKTWEAREAQGLDVEPETDNNVRGENHTVTATVYDQFGQAFQGTTTVSFEFFESSVEDNDGNTPQSADRNCTTNNSSSCSIVLNSAQAGKDLLCGWIGATPTMQGRAGSGTCNGEPLTDADDAPGVADPPEPRDDRVDVVEKVWDSSRLDCNPETDDNPSGSAHTITCNAKDRNNVDTPGVHIDMEATGANDPDGGDTPSTPDFTCVTDAAGNCSMTHGPGGTGTTRAAGTTTYRAWIDIDNDDSTVEADTTETQPDEPAEATDNTDVVTKTWSQTATRLDCTPEREANVIPSSHEVTCRATTADNAPVQGIEIDSEASGANDGDGDNPNPPDFTCVTSSSGSCSFTHAPNGGAEQGTTTYRSWVDSDDNDATSEADAAEGRDETTSPGLTPEPDATDVVEKRWSVTFRVQTIPAEITSAPRRNVTITAKVTDSEGNGLSGVAIEWSESGEGTFVTFETTTDANGEAKAVVTSTERGNQRVRATASPCDESTATCTDRSIVHWGPSYCSIFGTSGDDVLRGTSRGETICGFGGDDTLIGRGGHDRLIGGGGNDLLRGGRGRDTVIGSAGRDHLEGNAGGDYLRGRSGNDILFGNRGDDNLNGGSGRDRCRGGPGFDVVRRCER